MEIEKHSSSFVLLGLTGSGKSTLANTSIGKIIFQKMKELNQKQQSQKENMEYSTEDRFMLSIHPDYKIVKEEINFI